MTPEEEQAAELGRQVSEFLATHRSEIWNGIGEGGMAVVKVHNLIFDFIQNLIRHKDERIAALEHQNSEFSKGLEAYEKQVLALEAENRELREGITNIRDVWEHQIGRVFEAMGSDNPRAQAIDEAVSRAAALLSEKGEKAPQCTIEGCNNPAVEWRNDGLLGRWAVCEQHKKGEKAP